MVDGFSLRIENTFLQCHMYLGKHLFNLSTEVSLIQKAL
jgi:hypothetical protein